MKKLTLSLMMAACSLMAVAETARVMLWTDPHVLDTSLIAQTASMTQMMNTNRKMLDMSEAAMTALIDSALALQPDVVLIPGDLTKDGERISHNKVAMLLHRLTEEGIPVYVIPGNHDVGNPAAYSYKTDPAQHVDNITYADFRSIYADYGYTGAVAYDTASLSYVADIMPGVSLLAIDASDNNAGDGQVKPSTLGWMLAQADSAAARGNAVIAMQHWQLLDHVDMQSTVMSSATLLNRDAVRDSLMAHGVGLILTGHFHISGITTYHSVSAQQMVEVTTGAPITYPCPYRLLDLNRHDESLDVDIETRYIASLDTISDMWRYSEDWMQEHIRVIIPQLSNKVFSKLESMSQYAQLAGINLDFIPKDDSTRVAMFDRYMGDPVVTCYMIHSAANEWQDARSQGMESAIQDSIVTMFLAMQGITPGDMLYSWMFSGTKGLFFSPSGGGLNLGAILHAPLHSMLQDVTGEEEDLTNDLMLTLSLPAPAMMVTALTSPSAAQVDATHVYDMTGKRMISDDILPHGIYVRGGKKIVK